MATIRGGGKLEAALAEIASKVTSDKVLRVGFLEGSTNAKGVSIPMYAAVNEFGAPSRGQPPRPFFRNFIHKYSPGWPKIMKNVLKGTNYDVQRTFDLLGEQMEGELRQSINDLVSPPLAQFTIDRKGFDKPLIEHGDMVNSVKHEIV
jgi:hypothetical protein